MRNRPIFARVAQPLAPMMHVSDAAGMLIHNGNGVASAAVAAPALPPAAPPSPVIAPEAFRDLAPPPKAYELVVNAGAARVGQPWQRVLLMGVLAGLHIG